ncbi:hypothetical protein P168DRAFT_293689 [Aspergillus campestris IBT 28561]|uniref:Uncharacterized protein n=1 Tax=Aspergillus campestris (strain IBT 28561) TaxID=1392248 RepID=A0A2I1CR03_ASPC2|nr:uncharacterized protein P168DRAFT_293689 [Aspergillus campestris IBT 28561]PKY00052.1 hypothetical protein P168DRAFT_293689 [Aspergillus campestris IBT 28561]
MKAAKRKSLNDGCQPSASSHSSQPRQKRKAPKEPAAPTRRSSRLRARMLPMASDKVEPSHPPPKEDPPPEEEAPKETIQDLQQTIYQLREEMAVMRTLNHFINNNWATWASGNFDQWPKLMSAIFFTANQWSMRHGHVEIKALDRLTKEQKSQLIASLDGYCLQEDYDSLLSRISPSVHEHVPYMLLTAYVNKFIVENILGRPFGYMTTRPDPADRDESALDNDTVLANELHRLWGIFSKVDLGYAHVWRTITIRLANVINFAQGRNVTFGTQMREHRKVASKAFASSLLADPILRLLLREPNCPSEERRRMEGLCAQFEKAAQTATHIFSDHTLMEIHDLTYLAPRYHHASPTVTASYLHDIDEKGGETTIDDHQVVILTEPAIIGVPRWSGRSIWVGRKGLVLVEDLRDLTPT